MALQWLNPVDYDWQEAMPRLPDTFMSIRELAAHAPTCPIAAVSLQLDWTLIQGKPKSEIQLLRGVSGNTPSPMPILNEALALPDHVVEGLFESDEKSAKHLHGRLVRCKTREQGSQPCDGPHAPSRCFSHHQMAKNPLPSQGARAQVTCDDQVLASGSVMSAKVQPGTDGPQHCSKASFRKHDAASFFLQLAQTKTPSPNETGHGSGNQHGRKASIGNTRSTVISLDLPTSHQSILFEIKAVCDAICQELPTKDKTVLAEALLCTKQLDSAIQEIARASSPSPDQIALMKAYAALAVLKQTAICIAQYGLSCAYMVRSCPAILSWVILQIPVRIPVLTS